MPNWDEIFDINNDGGVNANDITRWMEVINNDGNVTNQEQAFVNQLVNWVELQGNSDTTTWSSFTPPLPQEPGEGAGGLDTTLATQEHLLFRHHLAKRQFLLLIDLMED